MKLINEITVQHQGVGRTIGLYVGDLAALPASEAVDFLVVSAFPGDYFPTQHSLIGALDRSGVSVAELAKDRAIDLRVFSSCWLSHPIRQPNIHFQRVLCFEPAYRGRAPEVVGDIFRSLVPFVAGAPAVTKIAMPLVASGDQGEPAGLMLESLVDAAIHWLAMGLTLDRIKIVLQESQHSKPLADIFNRLKQQHAAPFDLPSPSHHFDAFISYSHKDQEAANALASGLAVYRPSLRIFLDHLDLHPGSAWQQKIFESLDLSKNVICLLSPDYLASKVCKEEFNIALMRHRETEKGVLLPIYLRSADLPGYMRMLQYEDVRESESARIAKSAKRLAARL